MTLINFDGQTGFKVPVSGSFTVPDTVVTDSPTDNANFDSIRAVAGGQLVAAYDDVAGTALQLLADVAGIQLYPGDVVACSAVGVPAAGNVTVTITSVDGHVRTIVLAGATAVAGVIGIYG